MSNQAKTYDSNDTVDIVVAANTVSVTSGSSFSEDTGVGQYGFPIGIFSTDGGTTWNECTSSDFSSLSGGSYLLGYISCSPTGVVSGGVKAEGGASSPTSAIFKYVLLATGAATTVPASVASGIGGNATGYVSGDVAYRKVISDNSYTTYTDGSLHTVAHGQSSIPFITAYGYGYGTTDMTALTSTVSFISGVFTGNYLGEDATNIYIYMNTGTYNPICVRMYDEAS